MIEISPLIQPIRGMVTRDGRLASADDMLQQLQHRAGGREGGPCAIPGLAALALLALKLKMRLSRPVLIADNGENLEMWVDAVPDGDETRLSITSWRSVAADASVSEELNIAVVEPVSALFFDKNLRLLSATGHLGAYLQRADFGRFADDILVKIVREPLDAARALETMRAGRGFEALATHGSMSLSGDPQLSIAGDLAGYRCHLDTSVSAATPVLENEKEASGVKFGRQIAPVLRQPLGRIIANAETIGAELNGPVRENYALYANDIANAARHLVSLVDDLGDMEAVEGADFVAARDNIELGDVARRVAGLLALKAADHRVRLIVPDDEQKVPAVAEFRRVLQILLNLVTNAIRYSPDGTEVIIDIAQGNQSSFIRVSDQGSGIAEADRERVFDKFERLGRSGDGGSGLGLYISRKLARAMGGDLTVDAAAGGGATFTLCLPAS